MDNQITQKDFNRYTWCIFFQWKVDVNMQTSCYRNLHLASETRRTCQLMPKEGSQEFSRSDICTINDVGYSIAEISRHRSYHSFGDWLACISCPTEISQGRGSWALLYEPFDSHDATNQQHQDAIQNVGTRPPIEIISEKTNRT